MPPERFQMKMDFKRYFIANKKAFRHRLANDRLLFPLFG